MNPSATKLARKYGLSSNVALALVKAGFRNPVRIERASKAALQRVEGVGPTTADKLKGR